MWDRKTGDPHDWGGLYDRFIVASRGAIVTALSTLDQWVVHDRPLSGVPSRPLHANAEVALQAALADGGVDVYRTPRRMLLVHAVAEANNGDRSRWSTCTLRVRHVARSLWLCAKACSSLSALPTRVRLTGMHLSADYEFSRCLSFIVCRLWLDLLCIVLTFVIRLASAARFT